MKKFFLAASLLTATFAFVACGGDEAKEATQKNDAQNQQIDSLKNIIAEQELAIVERDSLFAVINEVDNAFTQLESEYVALQQVNRKNPEASPRRLTDRVTGLQQAMAANKAKIQQLNGRITKLNNQNKDLQAYITRLEERCNEQEVQIKELVTELENS